MNLLEPAKTFTEFAVQNAVIIACLIYISSVLRWDARMLVGYVYAFIFVLAIAGVGVEWIQGKFEDDEDEEVSR
jgi:hypothetical protein